MNNNQTKSIEKVLASPSSFGKIETTPVKLLIESGYEVIDNPYGRKLAVQEIIALARDCTGIVAGVEQINRLVLDSLPHLKCISRVGVGMDNIDLEYAKNKGIIVLNTPDGPTQSVAEFTLGMTLSLLRRIPQADSDMKLNVWKKQTGYLLSGKTIGIVGLGRIGKAVANMFNALGNKVDGYDLLLDNKWAGSNQIELLDLEDVLSNADIVSLHIPPTKNNNPVINKNLLSKIKKDSFLINLSRGGIVDEEALYKNLKNGHLAGAAIDVFQDEPYLGPLCELDNVVLTPHIGSYARESKLKMEIDAVNNLINCLKDNR